MRSSGSASCGRPVRGWNDRPSGEFPLLGNFFSFRQQPWGRLDNLHLGLIDMREHGFQESILDLLKFATAIGRACLGEQALIDVVLEYFGLGPISHAEVIISSLQGGPVHVRESLLTP